jgi:hypothetical protein
MTDTGSFGQALKSLLTIWIISYCHKAVKNWRVFTMTMRAVSAVIIGLVLSALMGGGSECAGGERGNLLSNGSFEEGLAGWAHTGAAGVTSPGFHGANAAILTLGGSSKYEHIVQATEKNTSSGKEYYLEGRIQSSGGFRSVVELSWIDKDGNTHPTVVWAGYDNTKEYILIGRMLKAPSDAVRARVKIQAQWGYLEPNDKNLNTLLIDNFKLFEMQENTRESKKHDKVGQK